MKIKYFFSSAAVFLAAAILFFASLMFVQALDARAETVINPQIIDRIESAEKPDISFLTTQQINNLAQLYKKKLKKIKAGKSDAKESADLKTLLKRYNVPDSVQAELDDINSKSLTWTANYNNVFVKSDKEKKKLSGLIPDAKIENLLKSGQQAQQTQGFFHKLLSKIIGYLQIFNPLKLLAGLLGIESGAVDNFGDTSLPAFFDWRNVGGKNYITPIRDQGSCGSCWAFATTAAVEGTINTYYNNPNSTGVSPNLSEQDLVSCGPGSGCNGATSDQIRQIFSNYLVNTGQVFESCFPYSATNSPCYKCQDWANQAWKTDASFKDIDLTNNNIQNIKSAIVNNGPVEVGMIVYSDFLAYRGGIYYHTTSSIAGYHAVTIVGYGSEDGLPFWIVKNSWGANWGENGYFKIMAGDSNIDQWFAYAPGIPYQTSHDQKLCTDSDGDGYCYWGTAAKPASGCPSSCDGQTTEDCDDSRASIYSGCGALTQKTGTLNIISTPSGANVYIRDVTSGNYIYRGQTPLVFNLNIGTRIVKIIKEDYIDQFIWANIIEGQQTSLNITLLMAPKMTNPLGNDVLRAGDAINITGNSGDIDSNTSYKIEWAKESPWSSQGIILSNNGTQKVNNGTLGQWNTSFVTESGYYSLRLTSIISGVSYIKYSQNIYLDPTLARGWPQRIPFYYGPGPFSAGGVSAFTTAKYYSVIQNNPQNNSPQVKTLINANKNSSGLYTINSRSFLSEGNSISSGYVYWNGCLLEPLVADLKGDGKKEIIEYRGGGIYPLLYIFNSDGSLFWKKEFTDYTPGGFGVVDSELPMPIAGDINNDGKNEIIVYVSNYNFLQFPQHSTLYALKGDGSVLWKAYVPTYYDSTLLMADLDGDGNKEIVLKGTGSSPISVLDNNGNIKYNWDLPVGSWSALCLPRAGLAVGHFDNSKNLQIVYITPSPNTGYDFTTQSWFNEAVMYVANKDGSVLPGWPIYLPGSLTSSPVVGDINKDGKDEIVVGLTYASNTNPDYNWGGFYAIDRNGKILPGWPVEKGWNFWSTPALGDVDGDGYLEISVGGYINGVISKNYLFRYDGSIMKGWPPQTTFYRDNYGSIIGDVNSDSKLDVLTTAGNGFYPSLGSGGVYAWDKDGSRIIGFPKPTEMDANAPAVLDDIDNDGKTELIASSDYDYDLTNFKPKGRGSVYVWNTNKTYNQANMPWPMFMHDPQHTGCYDCIEPSIIVTSPNGGETLEAGKSYDITWNSNGVDKAYIHLAVYNSNGVRAGLYYLAGGFSASLGKYTWKIPSYYALITNRSRSKIIISSTASITLPVNDSSDNYFSIAAPATNYCSQLQTRVTASMFKSCGQIDYSAVADINKDKAVNQYDQALLTANSNNETWCREKLNSTTSPCVVARPSVTITSPNGGEQLEIGKDYNITWTSSGVGQVNITAYNFSTLRVTTINIAQNVSAPSGSYVWTIPTGTATGTNVKITIRSTDGSVEDSTDNYFIIVE